MRDYYINRIKKTGIKGKNFISILIFIFSIFIFEKLQSQTIPATDGGSVCSDCTPSGWTDTGGTPDISDRNNAATSSTGGGGDLWIGRPLTLPPNGHTDWLSLRDLGSLGAEETVRATINGLTIGREYVVNIYALTALSDGSGPSSYSYASVYNDLFRYQIGSGTIQTIPITSQNTWITTQARFVAEATSIHFTLMPGNNAGGGTNTNNNEIETVQLSITINAINTVPDAIDDIASTTLNQPITFNVSNNDIDYDGAINDATVDLDPSTPGIQSTFVSANGTWSVNNAGDVTFNPNLGFSGTESIPYTIQDNYDLDGNNAPATSSPALIKVNILADSDSDGVSNSSDFDNDNDGILDVNENSCNLIQTGSWYNTGNTSNSNSGTTDINVSVINGSNTSISYTPNGTFNTNNFWAPSSIAGDISLEYTYNWNTDGTSPGTAIMTISFSETIHNPVIHVDRIGGAVQNGSNYFSNTAEFTLVTPDIIMSKIFGNNQFIVDGNKFYRLPNINLGSNPSAEANNGTGTAAGTLRFYGDVASLTFSITGVGPGSADAVEMIFQTCPLQDFDEDGIPNYLDIDSDNDGCPDAIEAAGDFTYNDLNTDETLSGSVDANGVPSIANGGQANTAAVTDANNSSSCSINNDTDGDGVNDNVDLDDDNDGILDTVENDCLLPDVANPNSGNGVNQDKIYIFNWDAANFLNGIQDGDSQTFNLSDGLIVNATFSNVVNGSTYIPTDLDTWDIAYSSDLYNTSGSSEAFYGANDENMSAKITFSATKNGVNYPLDIIALDAEATYDNSDPEDGEIITFSSNGGNWTLLETNGNGGVWQGEGTSLLKVLDTETPAATGTSIFYSSNASQISFSTIANGRQAVAFGILLSCDYDNDGIPNSVDNDSDNDGCFDALEAEDAYTISDVNAEGELNGSVDANGIPTIANGGQNTSNAVLNELDSTACLVYPDSDNDGINDNVDLDDDNDGILDSIETNSCPASYTLNETFGQGNRTSTPYTNYIYESIDLANGGSVNDGEYAILNDIQNSASWASCYWVNNPDHTGNSQGRMALFNATIDKDEEFYNRPNINVNPNTYYELSFWALNADLIDNCDHLNDRNIPNISVKIKDNSTGTVFAAFQTGDITKDQIWHQYTYIFNSETSSQIRLVLINNAEGGLGNDVALDDISIKVVCDTDGDGIPNHLDVDSDEDGCYDAVEGEGNFIEADLDAEHSLGDNVDSNGVPIVANGGQNTTPDVTDSSLNSQCNEPPVANDDNGGNLVEDGANGTINILNNDTDPDGNPTPSSGHTVDLDPITSGIQHTFLDSTGLWTYSPSNGVLTFDPADDYNGTAVLPYTLCDSEGLCESANITFNVTPVNDPPIVDDDSNTIVEDGGPATGDLTNAGDYDPDGTQLSVNTVPVSGPNNGTIIINSDGTYSYTPNPNFNGVDVVIVEICDNGTPLPSQCVNQTLTITVTPVDDVPVANDDTITVAEDTVYNGNVTSNDIPSADGGNTYSLVSGPSHGTLTFNADGTYTYTPSTDYNGSDSFTYELCDADGDCDQAVVSINVTPVDDVPVANDDTITVAEDTVYNGNVTSNDIPSADGGNTYSLVSGPSHGTLTFNADGTYTYTPSTDYNGSDSFTYELCDADGDCDQAVVSINVTPVDDVPVANDDTITVAEDTVYNGNVTSNDIPSADGGNTYSLVSGPSHGTLTFNADGTYTYTPSTDYNGSDSFTYELCDADGDCDQAVVSINVTPVDDVPVANDDTITVAEDTVYNGNVTSNDIPSADGGNTYSLVSGPSHGTLTFNADGTYTYTPSTDYNGSDSFTYELCDADGDCDQAVVSINVTPVDDVPVANDDTITVAEDTVYNGNVTSNDIPSADGGNTYSLVSGPSHGTLTFNADGTYTYTPSTDYNGSDSFTYELCDADGDCDQAVVSINVTPVDDVPVANDDTITVAEDTVYNGNVTSNDIPSADGGNTYSLVSGPSHGTLTFNADGTYTYTPSTDYNGSDSFTYELCDADGDCDQAVVSINVTPVDDVPVANDDTITVAEDTVYNGNVTSNDIPSADGGNTYSLVSGPSHGTLTFNADGTYTYTPSTDYNGSDSFTYELCDADGDCDQAVVSINVTPVDDVPVANDDIATTDEDTPVTIDILGNDTDVDGNLDPTTVTITDQPDNGTVTVDPVTGEVEYTPNPNFNGTDTFEYQVCDTEGLCDIATVTVTVVPVNDPPVIEDVTVTTTEDTPIEICLPVEDIESGSFTASLCGDPSNGTLSAPVVSGNQVCVTYTPNPNYNGTDTFCIEVCDNGSPVLCDTATVTVNVTPINDAPVANDDIATTDEDTPVTIDILDNDTDVDGNLDPTTVTITDQPDNGTVTVDPVTGEVEYIPNPNFNGTDTFEYQVCDTGGLCDIATVTVTVVPVNDPPVIEDVTVTTTEDTPIEICLPVEDIESGSFTASLCGDPSNGTLSAPVVSGNQVCVTYTPNPNYNGTDTFCIEVCDNGSPVLCDTATVTVNVTPINDAPVANDDIATTDEDTPVTIDILDNDTDVDGNLDPTTVTITDQPDNGTVTVDPVTGEVEYTPNPNFNGTDTFEYQVCDTEGLCDIAIVTITINLVDDFPVAINDSITIIENSINNNIDVLINDDFGGDGASQGTILITVNPLNGVATVDDNGTPQDPTDDFIVYTPNVEYFGNDVLTYQLCDSDGDCVSADVNIIVLADNDNDGIPDSIDIDDDNDGLTDVEEQNGNPSLDTDNDGIIDSFDLDSDNDGIFDVNEAGHEQSDSDNDGMVDGPVGENGLPDIVEGGIDGNGPDYVVQDSDLDGIHDFQDIDDDGDSVNTEFENPDPNGDGNPDDAQDSDADGTPDYLDIDDDGDSVNTEFENPDPNGDGNPDDAQDSDADGTPDYLDIDDDGDSVNTEFENPDPNGDGNPDDAQDSDADGTPDYLDIDDDGDSVNTEFENPDPNGDGNPDDAQDSDADGTPDYLDIDDDGDSVNTEFENPDPNGDGNPDDAQDSDADGTPDYLDIDDDGDSVNTEFENPDPNGDGNPDDAQDSDADGTPDYLDIDDDGDSVNTEFENPDPNGDGNPDDAQDSDADGTQDYLDIDDDGDSVNTEFENPDPNGDGNPDDAQDSDADGTPDYLDIDDDGDSVNTEFENPDPNGDGNPDDAQDSDADGTPDYLDIDDDGDSVNTEFENPDPNGDGNPDDAQDSDADGTPDYLDIDDDGDSVNTEFENPDPNGDGNPDDAQDSDADGTLDYLDIDDDGDSVNTEFENPDPNGDGNPDDAQDSDADGTPDYLDIDDDGDSVNTEFENPDPNGDGNPDDAQDSDADGTPDYLDIDDDGDSVNTEFENPDPNGDGNPDDAQDSDADGTPDYLDIDDDGDSVNTEFENPDPNGDGNPDDAQDSDADGTPDYLDIDDDGDSVNTEFENPDPNGDGNPDDAQDSDADGTPDYLDIDDDGDSVNTEFENPDPNGDGNPDDAQDSDADGTPDYLDIDDDGDGISTDMENPDPNGDGNPSDAQDTDGDGTPDYLDIDDDGDGIPTAAEDLNGDGNLLNDDTDNDGIPNYLDIDDDNDGILSQNESQSDTDEDGNMDYLDQDSDNDGISDNVEGQPTVGYVAPSNTDTDGDGLDDAYDDSDGYAGSNGIELVDTDSDEIDDVLDLDSDDDGVDDHTEAYDINQDGEADINCNEDSDNDGLNDCYDTTPGTPNTTEGYGDPNGNFNNGAESTNNTDGTDEPNFRDMDDDNDGLVTGNSEDEDSITEDCDIDGIPNYLDPESCDMIPTGFSPNGDSDNEQWVIPYLLQYKDFVIEVYDRWGNLVYTYSRKGVAQGDIQWWDGTSNGRVVYREGELLPAGTYFYIMYPNQGTDEPKTGWVYLNR